MRFPVILSSAAALVVLVGVLPAQKLAGHRRAPGPSTPSNYDMLIQYWLDEYGPVGEEQAVGALPFSYTLEAKAPKDECYGGIGVQIPQLPPNCPEESTLPKANGTYVWGLDYDEFTDTAWFGTGNNVQCLATASFTGSGNSDDNSDYVCEYEFGPPALNNPLWPDQYGDFRPPHIYSFQANPAVGGTLVDRTGQIDAAGEFLRGTTLGFRTVGVHNGVVLFGGPNIGFLGGINLFAFSTNGQYLGSQTLFQYSNIRKFIIVDGVMYCGVLNGLLNPNQGGSVLRWTGNLFDPFQFQVVATLDNEVAELTVHEEPGSGLSQKYLIATTWSRLWTSTAGGGELAGLFVSPAIPPGGLTNAQANGWTKVWQVDQYEPDPVTAASYGLGAAASFDGHVYFGTMHGVGIAVIAWINANGNPTSNQQFQQVFAGTSRPLAFFRGVLDFSGDGGPALVDVDLLYGARQLPAYNQGNQAFELAPNNTGPAISGKAGFNSQYNLYTWTAMIHEGLLYVGTLDLAYLFFGTTGGSPLPMPPEFAAIGERSWGCDLMVFAPGNPRGRKIVSDGFGNETNYGVRTMTNGPSGDFFIGTANPSTLKELGGWELIRVSPDFEN